MESVGFNLVYNYAQVGPSWLCSNELLIWHMLDGNHELLTAEVSHKGVNKPTMRQTGHANDLQERNLCSQGNF